MPRRITKFGLLFLLATLAITEARVDAIEEARLKELLEKARQRRVGSSDAKVNTTKTFEEETREVAGKDSNTSVRDLGYQTTKVLSTVDKTPISKDVQATQIQIKPSPATTPATAVVVPAAPATTTHQTINVVTQPVVSPVKNIAKTTPAKVVPAKAPSKPAVPVQQAAKKPTSTSPATTTNPTTISKQIPKPAPAYTPATTSTQRNPYIDGGLDKPNPKATLASSPTPRPKTTLQSKREASQAKPSTAFIQRDHKIKDDFVTNTSINVKPSKADKKTKQELQMPKVEIPKQEPSKPSKLGYEDLVAKKQDSKPNQQAPLNLSNLDIKPRTSLGNNDIDPDIPQEFSEIDNKKPDAELISMLQAYKETVRNEIKGTSKDVRTNTSKPETSPATAPSTTEPVAEAAHATSHEQDYMLVLRKSLKSLEEDSWAQVKQNMGESLDYFAREKELHPDNPDLDIYHRVIMGFSRFAEGGLELDEGDFADFEEAEALYLDCLDILEDAKSKITKDDLASKNIREIVNTVVKYTDEELEYIEEMIGL